MKETQMNQVKQILNLSNDQLNMLSNIGIVEVELSYDQMNQILNEYPDMINMSSRHNESPTSQEFIDFVKANPEFALEAYFRGLEGLDIVGARAIETPDTVYSLSKFIMGRPSPDEFHAVEIDGISYVRAWWD